MNRLVMLAGLMALAAMMAGCQVQKAMGNGPGAVAAVAEIDDEEDLASIVNYSASTDARVAAVKKISDATKLKWIVTYHVDNDHMVYPEKVFAATVERIMTLGCEDANMLEDDSFATLALKNANLPVEARIKAVKAMRGMSGYHPSCEDALNDTVVDKSAPMQLRQAAAEAIKVIGCNQIGRSHFAAIYAEYSAAQAEERKALSKLVLAWFNVGYRTGVIKDENAPIELRKLLYLSLRKLAEKGNDENGEAKRIFCGAENKEPLLSDIVPDEQLSNWAIANTKNNDALYGFVRSFTFDEEVALKRKPYRIRAASYITDDTMLEDLVNKFYKSEGAVAFAAHKAIKDAAKKKALASKVAGADLLDACLDKSKSNEERGQALEKLCKLATEKAIAVVDEWTRFDDRSYNNNMLGALEFVKNPATMSRLLKEAKTANLTWPDKSIGSLKKYARKLFEKIVEEMPEAELDKLVADTLAQAEEVGKDKARVVIGGTWLGMPCINMCALQKKGKTHGSIYRVGADEKGETLIVEAIMFLKGVYEDTGIEDADVEYQFPKKFGLADFRVEVSEIKRNDSLVQQISEAMGDYSNAYTGGDAYYISKTRAKKIQVTFWPEKGEMLIQPLND
ncbi:MAG: hypothetical protein IKP97_06365 [Kiritimatiellae bacterium]|nr:hypothetical protein [Kiritimatiellia bacterium]